MKALPEFKPHHRTSVLKYLDQVLTNHESSASHLHNLIEYEDGHYRALFRPDYFVLAEGQTTPTKSQWNSLKKKMRRQNPALFVFKEHGEVEDAGERYCYVDFGFFAR